ncbi:MAG: hypothetical protein JSV05_03240 [Candidatus Bathyarchaeota archaeon]|nr:MAG: hypothetical protein JSV05_03240 [Candidatus Bathyarchaeota archaeon]
MRHNSNGKKVNIPTTGRIGRLAQVIEKESSRQTLLSVMQDVEQYTSTNDPAKKAAWIKTAIERLEELVGREKTREIMKQCGRRCCGISTRKKARKLMLESNSIQEFIKKLNEIGIGGGRLQLEDNTITGGYDHCYCGQVKKTREPFNSTTYCHCSVGWYKQLFETALERPVEVEITQSIISGAKSCEFVIHI